MPENRFRGAVFGGFRRQDVLNYIKNTDEQYYSRVEQLKKQLESAQKKNLEHAQQQKTLIQENAGLLRQLKEMTQQSEAVREQLDEIERNFAALQQEQQDAAARAEQALAQNQQLLEQNATLSEKCGEYDASKMKLAEMELSAYHRAQQMEQQARDEVQRLQQQSAEMIAAVRKKLDAAKSTYADALEKNRQQTSELAQRAATVLQDIDRISETLGEQAPDNAAEQQHTRERLQQTLQSLHHGKRDGEEG